MNTAIAVITRSLVVALFAFAGAYTPAVAQPVTNIQTGTITWQVTQAVDLRNNATRAENYTLVTSPTSLVITAGQVSRSFTIQSTEGAWTNPLTEGMLTYSITYGNKQGTAVLQRHNNQLSMTLNFSSYPGGIHQKYLIQTYSPE